MVFKSSALNKDRIVTIDVIRGMALLGILVVNIAWFKSPVYQQMAILAETYALPAQLWDRWSIIFIEVFATGKFYPLFSFLFGLGFYLIMERMEQKGFDFRRLYARRMLFLLVLGLVHLIFIWTGDILHTYALAGFLLLLFANKSARSLLKWSLALLLITASVSFVLLLPTAVMEQTDFGQELVHEYQQVIDHAYAVFSTGTYTDVLFFRLEHEVLTQLLNNIFAIPNVLALFLLGMYAGRKRIFSQTNKHRPFIGKVWLFGLSVGGGLTALTSMLKYDILHVGPVWQVPLSQSIDLLAGPALMLFYVSSVILLMQQEMWQRLLRPLATVGRMALTNYLLQSFLLIFIFHGYGLGLYGTIGTAGSFLLSVMIFIIQVVVSSWWLKKYPFGPLEWLWRKWTYAS